MTCQLHFWNYKRRSVANLIEGKSMTKTQWKLFALWSAAEWVHRGPFQWEDLYESHRRSARIIGIPVKDDELRTVFEYCQFVTKTSEYPENAEGVANGWYPEPHRKSE